LRILCKKFLNSKHIVTSSLGFFKYFHYRFLNIPIDLEITRNFTMQLTLLVPILLLLTSIHALPTPEDSIASSNSTIASTDNTDDTDHNPSSSQQPVVATVDFWKNGGCQPQRCSHNFLVNLNSCNVVPKGCSTSAKITTGSDNCYCKYSWFPCYLGVEIWEILKRS